VLGGLYGGAAAPPGGRLQLWTSSSVGTPAGRIQGTPSHFAPPSLGIWAEFRYNTMAILTLGRMQLGRGFEALVAGIVADFVDGHDATGSVAGSPGGRQNVGCVFVVKEGRDGKQG